MEGGREGGREVGRFSVSLADAQNTIGVDLCPVLFSYS